MSGWSPEAGCDNRWCGRFIETTRTHERRPCIEAANGRHRDAPRAAGMSFIPERGPEAHGSNGRLDATVEALLSRYGWRAQASPSSRIRDIH
jgi:hypothetical protein